VAVVTGGDGPFTPAVRGVVPGGVIRLHDMAVDASRRVVSQICRETQHIQEETSAADKDARQAKKEYLLPEFELLHESHDVLGINVVSSKIRITPDISKKGIAPSVREPIHLGLNICGRRRSDPDFLFYLVTKENLLCRCPR
jgi:hypothetical protein